jgi:hypothetical protein
MKRKLLLITVIICLTPTFLFPQAYQAKATLDSSHILIGDYLNVRLSVTVPNGMPVNIPQLSQQMLDTFGIDFIGSSKIDTIHNERLTTLKQTIIITAFDSGSYVFPGIPIFGADTLILAHTEPLLFQVNTIPVDTTAAFRDIKQPVKVPLTFKEILPFILISLAIAAIFALLIYFIIKFRKKQKPQKVPVKVKPKVRPDIAALQALERLRLKKLWQEGKIKQFYTELTEILRTYLEGRYEVSAMEMVSSDILTELSSKEIPQEMREKLRELLLIADLVKFAKWDPLPTDHDLCFKNAREFVEKTAEKNSVNNKSDEPKKE